VCAGVGLLDAVVQLAGAVGGVSDTRGESTGLVGQFRVAVRDLAGAGGECLDAVADLDRVGADRRLAAVDLAGVGVELGGLLG
jgi:hypothetical protein